MKARSSLFFDKRGAAALEFALVGFPFILLLLGLIEFGRGFHIRNALDASADRAQRALMINPAASTDMLDAAIRNSFRAGSLDHLSVQYSQESVDGLDYRLLSLRYQMQLLLPAPLGRSITISSSRRVALPD